jgi:hypothetical protein
MIKHGRARTEAIADRQISGLERKSVTVAELSDSYRGGQARSILCRQRGKAPIGAEGQRATTSLQL